MTPARFFASQNHPSGDFAIDDPAARGTGRQLNADRHTPVDRGNPQVPRRVLEVPDGLAANVVDTRGSCLYASARRPSAESRLTPSRRSHPKSSSRRSVSAVTKSVPRRPTARLVRQVLEHRPTRVEAEQPRRSWRASTRRPIDGESCGMKPKVSGESHCPSVAPANRRATKVGTNIRLDPTSSVFTSIPRKSEHPTRSAPIEDLDAAVASHPDRLRLRRALSERRSIRACTTRATRRGGTLTTTLLDVSPASRYRRGVPSHRSAASRY
jgi:hypothetical protein